MPQVLHDPDYHRSPSDRLRGTRPTSGYFDQYNHSLPKRHCEVIGRFLGACTLIEEVAHISVRQMAGIDDPIGHILVGQPAFTHLLLTLTSLVEATQNAKPTKQLKHIYAQAGYVMSIRNIVAHQNPGFRPGWLRFSKAVTAKDLRNPNALIYPVRLSELDNLSVYAHLVRRALRAVTANDAEINRAAAELQAYCDNHAMPEDPATRGQRIAIRQSTHPSEA